MGPQNSLAIEIGGTAPGAFDQLAIDGTALLDGSLDVSLVDLGSGTYQPQSGDSFAIVSAASGLSGTFAGLNLPSLGGGLGWEVNPIGNTLFLDVVGGVLAGDFNNDGNLDGADIDSLVANVAAMTGDLAFDLTGDGALNEADLAEWLVLGGAENLASGNPYLSGDANLDGTVDGQDFLAWNNSKFSTVAAWTAGDFNADGVVDGQDFLRWNDNKFTSADAGGMTAVPEPTVGLWGLLLVAAWLRRRA